MIYIYVIFFLIMALCLEIERLKFKIKWNSWNFTKTNYVWVFLEF